MKKCDLVLIIPLAEEFRVLCEISTIKCSKVKDAIHFHALSLPGSNYQTVAVVLGEMGKTHASQITEKVLGYLEPKLAILLGICGALNEDLRLGDTIVASEVNEFLASSKAIQKDKSFAFQYSGNHWKTDFAIAKYIQNYEFTDKDLYDAWRIHVKKFRESLGLSSSQLSLASTMPKLKTGHIACGDTVVVSTAYLIELIGIDRKFDAYDMESAGFLQATSGREMPIRTMIVRGVADFANERKKRLESAGDGMWRRYAMYSASTFLLHLLRAKDFQKIIPPSTDQKDGKQKSEQWPKHYD